MAAGARVDQVVPNSKDSERNVPRRWRRGWCSRPTGRAARASCCSTPSGSTARTRTRNTAARQLAPDPSPRRPAHRAQRQHVVVNPCIVIHKRICLLHIAGAGRGEEPRPRTPRTEADHAGADARRRPGAGPGSHRAPDRVAARAASPRPSASGRSAKANGASTSTASSPRRCAIGIGDRVDAAARSVRHHAAHAARPSPTISRPSRTPASCRRRTRSSTSPKGTSIVPANMSILARQANASTSFLEPASQLGVSDLFVSVLPKLRAAAHRGAGGRVREPLRLARRVRRGALRHAADRAHQRRRRAHQPARAARRTGVLMAEEGLAGQTNKAGTAVTPDVWNDFANPNEGTSFVAHGHLGARGLRPRARWGCTTSTPGARTTAPTTSSTAW